MRSVPLELLHFPVFRMKADKRGGDSDEGEGDEKADEWALPDLDSDDDANQPDVILQDYDFNADRFAI